MKRRSFLGLLAGGTFGAAIPFNFSAKWLYPYAQPIYPHAATVIVGHCPYMLLQFNRLLKNSPDEMESLYSRGTEIMRAADNVTKQDIINEINLKWIDDEAFITTAAVFGYYDLNDKMPFQKHMKIKDLKQLIKYHRDRALSDLNEHPILGLGDKILGTRTSTLIGDTIYHKLIFNDPSLRRKNRIQKERLYCTKLFAEEMVAAREDHYSEKTTKIRNELMANYRKTYGS